ncbi:MAG: DoxX family membrane protein [Acidobacteriaceae bacterium]
MAVKQGPAETAWWALKLALGSGPILVGLDKFFDKITDWTMYLSPVATNVTHLSPAGFMHLVGPVEILAGVLVLSRYTKWGGYLVALWMLGIIGDLLTMHAFYDVALRDLLIGVAAFSLAKLTEARESSDRPIASSAVAA